MKEQYTDHLGNVYSSLENMCSYYHITIATYYTRKRKGWDLEEILTTPVKQIRKNHRGEKHINNDGLEFEILDSPDSHHITIKFIESGNIKTNVYYGDITRGMVKDRIDPQSHVGESKQMNCGQMATIKEFLGHSKYRIELDDGSEKISEYYRFDRGELGNTTTKRLLTETERIAVNGEHYKVLSEESGASGKCVIQFENGVQKIYTRKNVLNNTVQSTNRQKNVLNNTVQSTNRQKNVLNNTAQSANRPKQIKAYVGKFAVGRTIVSKGNYHYLILEEFDRGHHVNVFCEETQCEINGISPRTLINRHERNQSNKRREINAINRQKDMDAFINTVVKDRLGRDCTVVGGKDFKHLDIKRSDGTIAHNVPRYKFLAGLTPIADNAAKAQKLIYKHKYENMTVTQRGGYDATCISCQDSLHITIQYHNGVTQNTDVRHFTHGLCIAPMLEHTHQSSLNEFTLLYCFKQAGFIHTTAGMLRDLKDFKNKTLDLYHPMYKIGIEYDGPWHKAKLPSDLAKDKLCRKNDIYIYRIRELSLPLLNDGIAHEYRLDDNHYFGPAIRKIIQALADDIAERFNLTIQLPDLTDSSICDDIIKQYSNNYSFRSKIGKQNHNKSGYLMTITAYRNSNDIDIIFDNGYQTFHRNMSDFNCGNIARKEQHYGEIAMHPLGMAMEVISKEYGQRVDVRFEDGTVVENQSYAMFVRGKVAYPNRELYLSKQGEKHLHEIIETNCGLLAEITEIYRDNAGRLMCIARFEDGYISKPTAYQHAKRGYLKHPNSMQKSLLSSQKARHVKHQKRIDKLRHTDFISPDGYHYQIINFADDNHIRCRFEDGFELNTDVYSAQRGIWRYLRRGTNKRRNTGDFVLWCKGIKQSDPEMNPLNIS